MFLSFPWPFHVFYIHSEYGDEETMISSLVKFKIQYRTLADLCGLYLLHMFDRDLNAIKPLLPELVYKRIEDMLPLLEDFPNRYQQPAATNNETKRCREDDLFVWKCKYSNNNNNNNEKTNSDIKQHNLRHPRVACQNIELELDIEREMTI